jgi:hypothetical protein
MHMLRAFFLLGLVHIFAVATGKSGGGRGRGGGGRNKPPSNRPGAGDPDDDTPQLRFSSITEEDRQRAYQVLNNNLETVNDVLGQVVQVVSVFNGNSGSLSSPATATATLTTANSSATCKLDLRYGELSRVSPLEVTPTTTLPSSSYYSCKSWASIVSRCSFQTSSFYNLPPTNQASCACFSESTTAISCTTGGSGAFQNVVRPTFAPDRFDGYARDCRDYFQIQGYTNIASALSGLDGSRAILGVGFCSNVQSALGNSTTRLQPSATPLGYCISLPTSRGHRNPRVSGFTKLDISLFVSFAPHNTEGMISTTDRSLFPHL